MLIDAVAQLRDEGRPLTLEIVGATAPAERAYWDRTCAAYRARLGNAASFNGWVAKDAVGRMLLRGDIYATASFSEGSSQAVTHALATGIPVVGARTGTLSI